MAESQSDPEINAEDASSENLGDLHDAKTTPEGDFVLDAEGDLSDILASMSDPALSSDAVEDSTGSEQGLLDEIERLKDEMLRTRADYANFIRVSERNVANAREQTTLALARNLVPVLDTFDLTLQQDVEKISGEDLLKGVGLVRDQLTSALTPFGLAPVVPQPGDEFDAHLHTAIMRQPVEADSGIESGAVVMVIQAGYLINDKPVRPAQVAVAE